MGYTELVSISVDVSCDCDGVDAAAAGILCGSEVIPAFVCGHLPCITDVALSLWCLGIDSSVVFA